MFRQLGVDTTQGAVSAYEQLAVSLAKVTDRQKAVAVAAELLGARSGTKVLALGDQLYVLERQADATGQTLSSSLVNAGGSADDALTALQRTIDSLINRGIEPLIPKVTEASQRLTDFLSQDPRGLELARAFTEGIGNALDNVTRPELLDRLGQLVQSFGNLASALGSAGSTALSIAPSLDTLAKALESVSSVFARLPAPMQAALLGYAVRGVPGAIAGGALSLVGGVASGVQDARSRQSGLITSATGMQSMFSGTPPGWMTPAEAEAWNRNAWAAAQSQDMTPAGPGLSVQTPAELAAAKREKANADRAANEAKRSEADARKAAEAARRDAEEAQRKATEERRKALEDANRAAQILADVDVARAGSRVEELTVRLARAQRESADYSARAAIAAELDAAQLAELAEKRKAIELEIAQIRSDPKATKVQQAEVVALQQKVEALNAEIARGPDNLRNLRPTGTGTGFDSLFSDSLDALARGLATSPATAFQDAGRRLGQTLVTNLAKDLFKADGLLGGATGAAVLGAGIAASAIAGGFSGARRETNRTVDLQNPRFVTDASVANAFFTNALDSVGLGFVGKPVARISQSLGLEGRGGGALTGALIGTAVLGPIVGTAVGALIGSLFKAPTVEDQLGKSLDKLFETAGVVRSTRFKNTIFGRDLGTLAGSNAPEVQRIFAGSAAPEEMRGDASLIGRLLFGAQNQSFANTFTNNARALGQSAKETRESFRQLAASVKLDFVSGVNAANNEVLKGKLTTDEYLRTIEALANVFQGAILGGAKDVALALQKVSETGRVSVEELQAALNEAQNFAQSTEANLLDLILGGGSRREALVASGAEVGRAFRTGLLKELLLSDALTAYFAKARTDIGLAAQAYVAGNRSAGDALLRQGIAEAKVATGEFYNFAQSIIPVTDQIDRSFGINNGGIIDRSGTLSGRMGYAGPPDVTSALASYRSSGPASINVTVPVSMDGRVLSVVQARNVNLQRTGSVLPNAQLGVG
jgi:hypothetical protein